MPDFIFRNSDAGIGYADSNDGCNLIHLSLDFTEPPAGVY